MNESCEFLRDALPDHEAGRLEPERARRVEAHLEGCERCREEAAAIRLIAASRVRAPAGLADRVAAAVSGPAPSQAPSTGPARPAPPASTGPRWGWRQWALPLAAAAALATVLVQPGVEEAPDADVAVVEAYAPYGDWPAGDGVVAGHAVLSDLTAEQLERLLEEMES